MKLKGAGRGIGWTEAVRVPRVLEEVMGRDGCSGWVHLVPFASTVLCGPSLGRAEVEHLRIR